MANKNIRSLSYRKELKENLFEQIANKASSETDLKQIAKDFLIDESVVYGTSSFYDFTKNTGKKIHVCNGTACMVARTQNDLSSEVEKHFSKDEIGHAACIGHCHTNSAFLYNDKTFSGSTAEELETILKTNPESNNEYEVQAFGTPILTGDIPNLENFYSLAQKQHDKAAAIEQLKISNLRGRGGAGFPFWFKLDAVYKEDNEQKYIVCNADEGDPGAYSDMYLLEKQPHKVLFGMYMAGLCVGANTGVLYIRGEYPESVRIMEHAIEEFYAIQGNSDFRFKVIKGQGSYVCGEETALLSSIEGMRPEVRVRPPYPAQYGLYGKPTVLSNVETFANVHWILENGGDAYASIGTAKSTGTKLISLDSYFNRPGMYELDMGTPMMDVIEKAGKGFKSDVKALQVGGPLGGIIPVHKMEELTLDFESLQQNNFLLGHASFVSIPQDYPMIDYLEHLLKFTADESCGKCYPCRIGAFRGYEMIGKSKEGSYKIDKELFDDLLETLEIGSLCALGGGVPLPIKNALHYFETELKEYFN